MTQPATPLLSEPGQTCVGQSIASGIKSKMLYGFVIALMGLFLLAGCSHTPKHGSPGEERVARWLEARISPEGARHWLLDNIDHMTQTIQKRTEIATAAADRDDYQGELDVLARTHEKLSLALESFLSGCLEGDELWTYRTFATADRGGEGGIAIVRDGKVIQHKVFVVYD
jgi:hypothetical protein